MMMMTMMQSDSRSFMEKGEHEWRSSRVDWVAGGRS